MRAGGGLAAQTLLGAGAGPMGSGGNSSVQAVVVDTHFHVITWKGEGMVTQSSVDGQVDVLNKAYFPYFQFRLVTSRQLEATSEAMFRPDVTDDYAASEAVVASLRQGNHSAMNVVTWDLGGGLLGLAYFPTMCMTPGCKENAVLIDYRTVPGVESGEFSFGDTLVHEVGHWLGLYHTFEGESCRLEDGGDFVADTPWEREPAYDCVERDSCRSLPGFDPIHNYMDYTADACMDRFSIGQFARMAAQWELYRLPPFKPCSPAALPAHPECSYYATSCYNPLHCARCADNRECGACAAHEWPADGACDGVFPGSTCRAACKPGFGPPPPFYRDPQDLPAASVAADPITALCGVDGTWIAFGGCVPEALTVPPKSSSTGKSYTVQLSPAADQSEARAACRARGGDLATLPDAQDAAAAAGLMEPYAGWTGLATRGGARSGSAGAFSWLTTDRKPSSYGFSAWARSDSGFKPQPDNAGGREGRCAVMDAYYDPAPWFDWPEGIRTAFVCQIGCSGVDLPAAPASSAWPAALCDGRASGGAACVAGCAPGSVPGPQGAPSASCQGAQWSAVSGSCIPAPPCPAASLPKAPDNSAWPAAECDGRPSRGAACVAACASGYVAGTLGPPATSCEDGRWTDAKGSCVLDHCLGSDLPAPAANSTWPPECDGRPWGAACTAACRPGYFPGPKGAPTSACVRGQWSAVGGSCVLDGCAVFIEPADPDFANGASSPISLSEVQLFATPGGRMKRPDLQPALSGAAADNCFDGRRRDPCQSVGDSPVLAVRYPCTRQLTRVVVQNVVARDKAALGRVTAYRLRTVGAGEGAAASLAFKDAGVRSKYTARLQRGVGWAWSPRPKAANP
ncbi:MAG: hypothetical protein J3K34DRAFT_398393 [Monoraphidium minutum]|nr:MAG: hypothetical protein J3K34DRAFT_398393 [Monoraphidium minutum]